MTSPVPPDLSASTASNEQELTEDDLADVLEAVIQAVTKYKFIGLKIGVTRSAIAAIEGQYSNTYDRLCEILSLRLRDLPLLTWQDIEGALRSKLVGEAQLADNIRASHCKQPFSQAQSQKKGFFVNSPIAQYIEYLKGIYRQSIVGDPKICKWPPHTSEVYINLAIIKSDSKPLPLKEADEYTRAMVIDGNLDAILEKKRPIEFSDIAKDISSGQIIVVEGAPGVGKSTFAWEFCRRWEREEIAQQYQLVLLIRLRDERMGNAKNLEDVICHPFKDDIVKELESTLGANTLIILEGFDELSDTCRKSSLFTQIINGEIPTILKANVLVTSRQWATSDLRNDNKSRIFQYIEILGFTESQINDYITISCKKDEEMIDGIKNYLQKYPQIKACMYIPINTAIVVEVYRECMSRGILPQTLTELYYALVQSLLLRYLRGHDNPLYRKKTLLTIEKDLPEEVYTKFLAVCRLAYKGVCTKVGRSIQLVFSDLPPDFETLGLLQSVPQLYVVQGEITTHNFLHLTVQEFLAAFHILNMPPNKQLEHYKKQKEGAFNVVLKFLAGLTKLVGISSKEFKCLLEDPNERDKEKSYIDDELPPCVVLHSHHANWIFEAKIDDITTLIQFPKYSNITEFIIKYRMPLLGFYSLGYCIVHSNSNWILTFESTGYAQNFTYDGLKEVGMLVAGASTKKTNHVAKVVALRGIDEYIYCGLSLSHEVLNSFMKDLRDIIDLRELSLNLPKECNSITWPKLSGLQVLHLEISGERNWNMSSLLELLCGRNIRSLTIRKFYERAYDDMREREYKKTFVGLRDCTAVAKFLSSAQILEHFRFSGHLTVDDKGMEIITKALNHNSAIIKRLIVLGLECKCTFSDIAAEHLANIIRTTDILMYVVVCYCEFNTSGLLQIARANQKGSKAMFLWNLRCTVGSNDQVKDLKELLELKRQWVMESLCVSYRSSEYVQTITETFKRGTGYCGRMALDLILSQNNISDLQAIAISDVFRLSHNSLYALRRLDLSGNCITDAGMLFLSMFLLDNCTVLALLLSSNKIGNNGVVALSHALRGNSTLVSIDLSDNNAIGSVGALKLMEVLSYNPKRGVGLEHNQAVPWAYVYRLSHVTQCIAEGGVILPEIVHEFAKQSPHYTELFEDGKIQFQ